MMGFHQQSNLERSIGSVDDDGAVPSNCNIVGANEVVNNINVSSSQSQGGEKIDRGMAASVVFPFTFAQWKELERQAMIYKYIIASVPVPADLLFPLSRNYPDSSVALAGGSYNVRYSKNGDPEPGRCKRTDGKKWRCSRDVAPHQKYCERHLHRGRPRSRKRLEAKNNGETQKKAARLEQSHLPTVSNASQQFAAPYQPRLLCDPKIDPNPHKEINRDLGSVMKSDIVTTMNEADLQWQHLIEAQMELTNASSVVYNFHQDYLEQQSLSYSNLCFSEVEVQPGFIDAESSLSSDHLNLSPSLEIPMSMAGNSSHHAKDCDYHRTTNSIYLSPVSWEPFGSGGPLAEVLNPGSASAAEESSPRLSATTVSSPSGVLHRTLFSYSDGSVCNSPSEGAFQWLI